MIVTEMELALGILVTFMVGIAFGQYLRIKVYIKKPEKEEKVKE